MTKSELRKKILALRSQLSEQERAEKSEAIAARLFSLKEFRQANCILFFIGFGSEVDTLPMVKSVLLQGKKVAAPKVIRGKKELELRLLSDPSTQLHPGAMGILEPDDTCLKVSLKETNLIIVPAVAWDEAGYRVGYGGGFYDRLLSKSGKIPKIGIGFECQVVAEVPRANHDLGVDILITENRILKLSTNNF